MEQPGFYGWVAGNLGFVEMQNAEVRMQNNDFTFGFRLTSKQKHLRKSQVFSFLYVRHDT